MKIVIQPGHVNTTTGATGAPGERDFNLDVANQVSSELRKRGFEIKQSDANVHKDSDVLNSDKRTTLVVPGIVKGICKAFNIPYDITPPQPPVDPCAEVKKQLEVTKADLANTKELLNQTLDKLGKILAWHKNFPQ